MPIFYETRSTAQGGLPEPSSLRVRSTSPVAYAALSGGCRELEWRCEKCKKGSSKPLPLDALIADRFGEVLTAIGGGVGSSGEF